MKDKGNLKTIGEGMRGYIWERDERLCKKCQQLVYHTFTPRGVIHHIDFDRTNNYEYNLLLLCSRCHRILHQLYWRDFYEYGWAIELITKTKCVLPHDGGLSNDYRYTKVLKSIKRLEQENNVLALPRRDLDLLEYLKALEKRLLAEHNKAEEKAEEGDIK